MFQFDKRDVEQVLDMTTLDQFLCGKFFKAFVHNSGFRKSGKERNDYGVV